MAQGELWTIPLHLSVFCNSGNFLGKPGVNRPLEIRLQHLNQAKVRTKGAFSSVKEFCFRITSMRCLIASPILCGASVGGQTVLGLPVNCLDKLQNSSNHETSFIIFHSWNEGLMSLCHFVQHTKHRVLLFKQLKLPTCHNVFIGYQWLPP